MKRFIGSLCLFFVVSSASAKITIDNVSQSAFASATSVTWTHVLGTAANCPNSCLIVDCGNDASTFSSIKYAGIALTQQLHFTSTETQDIWTLCNSTTTGSNSIVATNGAAVDVICGAVSLCNVNPNTPKGATATSQATGTNPNIAITLNSSGSWVLDGMFNNGTTLADSPRTSANVITSLFNAGGPSTDAGHFLGPLTSGSVTLSWTEPTSAAWTKIAMEIQASTGTPIVTTNPPTSITGTTATGNGVLLSSAGFSTTDTGVCYGTAVNPAIGGSCVSASNAQGAFTASITGLTAGTGYHIRAYATNSVGTDYGADIPFQAAPSKGRFITSGTGKLKIMAGNVVTTALFAPTVAIDSASLGSVSWTGPTNVEVGDLIVSSNQVNNPASITDASVRLVGVSGSLISTDQADKITTYPTFPVESTATYVWTSGISCADVQSSTFGIAYAVQQLVAPTTSHYLIASNYASSTTVTNCLEVQAVYGYILRAQQTIKSFVKGTLVSTPRGMVPIEVMKKGDEVYSYDEENGAIVKSKVQSTLSHIDPEIVSVETDEGAVSCSPEHRFYTDQGIKKMSELSVGSYLKRWYGFSRIKRMKWVKRPTVTYEIFLNEPHNYFANGFLVHNVTNGDANVDLISLQVRYIQSPATGYSTTQ